MATTNEDTKSCAADAVGLNDLAPCRYTAGNYGCVKSIKGDWLLRGEILDAIDFILQDDSKLEERLIMLRDNLTG